MRSFSFFSLSYFQLEFISSSNNSNIVISTTIAIAVYPSFVICRRFNTNLSVR
jgi:hypothetical protein